MAARQDVVDAVTASYLREAVGVDGVEGHVDPVEPMAFEAGGALGEPNPVGDQGNFRPRRQFGGRCDDVFEMPNKQRFASGEANAGDTEHRDRNAE